LENGQIRLDGPTDAVVREYLTSGFVAASETELTSPGDGPVRLREVRVVTKDGQHDRALLRTAALQIVVRFEVVDEVTGLDLAVFVVTATGVRVIDEVLSDSIVGRFSPGPHEVTMELPPVLNVGRHTVGVWLGTAGGTLVEEPTAASFELLGSDRGRRDRAVVLDLPFRVSD
jgi:ABC-2 type transport system ATP-binding protein/lipopolysaccharide transport system ATP-binding protein